MPGVARGQARKPDVLVIVGDHSGPKGAAAPALAREWARNRPGPGCSPFADPKVAGVTGTVLALNPHDGLLPALVDVRYANAFLGERAAYSRLGSVLCACGSSGDDRRLTRYALEHGHVVLPLPPTADPLGQVILARVRVHADDR